MILSRREKRIEREKKFIFPALFLALLGFCWWHPSIFLSISFLCWKKDFFLAFLFFFPNSMYALCHAMPSCSLLLFFIIYKLYMHERRKMGRWKKGNGLVVVGWIMMTMMKMVKVAVGSQGYLSYFHFIYMRLSVSFLARDATVICIYSLLFLYFGNVYSHKYTAVICGG